MITKINAKEELLNVVKENNLTIVKIDCKNWDGINHCYDEDADGEFVKENLRDYTSLSDLDFDYYPDNDNWDYCLYGIVYCYDEDNNPVWLTRECSDYVSEHWEVNKIPDFYKK